MRCISQTSCRVLRHNETFSPFSAACSLQLARRRASVAGGGRGDLFTRHAGQYKEPYAGAARGITHLSESTQPQNGQLHVRKRRDHLSFDRVYSGAAYARPALAAWSYLIPSLRAGVEATCSDALYAKLLAGEASLTVQEEQQLAEAQSLFRFELQQRIGLLEDSLAEAELPYLIQWPSLFQRVWLRLPLHISTTGEVKEWREGQASSPNAVIAAPTASSSATAALIPVSTTVWASSSSSLVAPAQSSPNAHPASAHHHHHHRHTTSFHSRLSCLTGHVVESVAQELRQLETTAPLREDGAPRSRRQAALEAAWRTQWQSSVRWHADTPQ